jgi:hypothetical protein
MGFILLVVLIILLLGYRPGATRAVVDLRHGVLEGIKS